MSAALQMLSTPDLEALQSGDLSKVSTQGLQMLQREQMRSEMGVAPLEVGNIDLKRRPVVSNPDGSISTVRSIGVNLDGTETLIPTVSDDGRVLSDAAAIDLYRRTGRHLGKFSTPEEATTYAEKLHKAQEDRYFGAREAMRKDFGLDPSKGGSTVLAGIGGGMASGLRALGAGGLVEKMGLPSTQAEAKVIDAPLDATMGGKIGRGLGLGALAAPTALIPGANTYVGATLLGGLAGGALTEGDLGDRAKGAAFGAVGGAAGKFVGDKVGQGASYLLGKRAADRTAAQVANAQRDAAAVTAREAGYVIPPADVRQSAMNEALNGMSGKIKTAQVASQRNQGITNSLARKELGIADDVPLNAQTLNAVRNEASKAYQAVEGVGTITPGESYTKALDKIVEPYIRAGKSFPNSRPNPIVDEIATLKTAAFDAGDAVAKIRTLRADADAAYGAGNKELGKSLKAGADALEQAIDDHLAGFGPSKLLSDYRAARQLIAKTYSVQKGLNDVTGDVSAAALAKQLEKGKPLSGELEKIARVAQAFPKATQLLKEAPKSVSPLDLSVAAISGTATGSPAALAMMGARPAMRSLVLSPQYQARMLNNTYAPTAVDSLGLPLLQSDILRRSLLPLGVGASVPANQ